MEEGYEDYLPPRVAAKMKFTERLHPCLAVLRAADRNVSNYYCGSDRA